MKEDYQLNAHKLSKDKRKYIKGYTNLEEKANFKEENLS